MPDKLPIIRLEIGRMKQTILTALTEHAASMDKDIAAAIEAYCSPENIALVLRKEVTDALNVAVKEEIRIFFQHSAPGRQAVREAVIAYLNEWDRLRSREEL